MDTTQVTYAVAQLLHDAGVGVWSPTGTAYTSAQVGIFYGALAAAPDRAIGVTVYSQDDDILVTLQQRSVQIRYRGAPGAPNGADILADAGFAALQGIYHVPGIARITRAFVSVLGPDTSGRQERTDNYLIVLDATEASS